MNFRLARLCFELIEKLSLARDHAVFAAGIKQYRRFYAGEFGARQGKVLLEMHVSK